MAKANQRMRQMQLSLEITSRLNARHVQRIVDDDALWRFASPAQARLVMAAPERGTGHDALDARGVVDARRDHVGGNAAADRPSGAISRRAATAVRLVGMQTPAATSGTAISSMFRLVWRARGS